VSAVTQRLEGHYVNREKEKKCGRKYIWSEEIEDAIRKKKSSYLTALSTKKPQDWENYKNDKRNVNVCGIRNVLKLIHI
jgi:hypothetical protein